MQRHGGYRWPESSYGDLKTWIGGRAEETQRRGWEENNRDLRRGNWVILSLDNEGLQWIRYGGGEGAAGSPRLKGKKSKKSGVWVSGS